MRSIGLKTLMGAALLSAAMVTPAFAGSILDGLSGTADFTTNYLFRGITNNNDDPTAQAGLNYDLGSGFSVGTWTSAIDFGTSGHLEVDWFGNYTTTIDAVDVTLGAIYYTYPMSNSSLNYDYFEGSVTLSHDFGPFAINGSLFISPEFPAKSGAAEYIQGGVTVPITSWLSAAGNYGYQWVDKNANFGFPDYSNWNLGLTATWKAYSLNLMYSQTDLPSPNDKAKFLATVGVSF